MSTEESTRESDGVFMLGWGFFTGWLFSSLILGIIGAASFIGAYYFNLIILSAGCLCSVLAFRALKA